MLGVEATNIILARFLEQDGVEEALAYVLTFDGYDGLSYKLLNEELEREWFIYLLQILV